MALLLSAWGAGGCESAGPPADDAWLRTKTPAELEHLRARLYAERSAELAEYQAGQAANLEGRLAAAREKIESAEPELAKARAALDQADEQKRALLSQVGPASGVAEEDEGSDWANRLEAVRALIRAAEAECVKQERQRAAAQRQAQELTRRIAQRDQLARSLADREKRIWQVEEALRRKGN